MRLTRLYAACAGGSLGRNLDLNFQIADKALSCRVPGTARVHLDVLHLQWLRVDHLEDVLVSDGDAVNVLGSKEFLADLNAGPFPNRGDLSDDLGISHLSVQGG